MKRICLATVLFVTACTRPAPIDDVQTSASQRTSQSSSSSYTPHYYTELQDAERPLLMVNPSLASRKGDTLTISYNGKVVARLRAAMKTNELPPSQHYLAGCSLITLNKVVALFDSNAHATRTYAVLRCMRGEADFVYLMLSDGSLFPINAEPYASPDGKTLASGDFPIMLGTRHLRMTDWPSRTSLVFASLCHVESWDSTTSLNAVCVSTNPDSAGIPYHAHVSRTASGGWHLQGTAWAIPSKHPEAHPLPASDALPAEQVEEADKKACPPPKDPTVPNFDCVHVVLSWPLDGRYEFPADF